MADSPLIPAALLVTGTDAASKRLARLVEIVSEAGVSITEVESFEEAAAQILVSDPNEPRLVLVDGIGPDDKPTEDIDALA